MSWQSTVLRAAAPRFFNVLLRALAMASRFVLLFALARLLEPDQVGLFGLFLATVAFSVLVVGADYYTYSQRELLSRPRESRAFVLQHQALATLLLYLVLVPPQILLFSFELLPVSLAVWFFVLLVLEHLAQELNRLLVAMERPLIASWVLFIRMGVWVWIVVPLAWFNPAIQKMESVFFAWTVGCVIAILVGARVVWQQVYPWRRWPLDRAWLRRGFGVGLKFLGATMCFKALQTVDRYVIDVLVGPELLGVYVLYSGIAMAVIGFLDPAVFSFLYPRMVATYRQGDLVGYRRAMREMAWSTILASLVLTGFAALLAPFVLEWTGRPIYSEHLAVLWLLLTGAVAYALGMIPHYGLYAMGADRSILLAHVSGLFVFGVTIALVAPVAALSSVAAGVLAAFVWMGLFKAWRYHSLAYLRVLDPQVSYPTAKSV